MSLVQLAYVIAFRRIMSNWRLEITLLLGIVLAVALMSSGVVFSDLLAEAALRRALNDATGEEANFSTRVFYGLDHPVVVPKQDSVYQRNLNFVEQTVENPFQPYLRDQALLVETSTFFFRGHPHLELDDDARPRGKLTHMTGLLPDHVRVVEGRWPYSAGGGLFPTGEPLEVAIDTMGARLLKLGVGDEMTVYPAVGEPDQPHTTVKIVALLERDNPADEFWYGVSRTFSSTEHTYDWVPLFTTENAIIDRVARTYPTLYTDVSWFYYLDRHGVRASDVGSIQKAIRNAKYNVRAYLENSSIAIKLDRVLDDYEEQLLLARIPLFLMLFMVTGILIYYLALVAGLIVRSRSTEISMLKSRGSTTFQVGLLAIVEGLLLAIPAIALGPLLALGVSRLLGRVFFDVGAGGELVPIELSSRAFLLGVAGAVMAVAVLFISTLVAARHGIVELRQASARPSGTPIIHRYYLDIMALGLIGVIWWQIETRGSFLVRSLGSDKLEIDFSLLLSPSLGLLALGLLVLRFFPIGVAILAKVTEPLGPVWLVQGLRRVSRDPIMPGTLVVLLMLATALGVIGSAFSSTLERSQKDRALYTAGADLRIRHDRDSSPVPLLGLSNLAEEANGVVAAAEVKRGIGSLLTRGFDTARVSVLAVESDHFARVAWYRPDFAGGKSLEELISPIMPGSPSNGEERAEGDGIMLPRDATALALWVNPGRPHPQSFLLARLQDSRGYYFDVSLGELGFREWRRLEAGISSLPPRRRGFRDRSQSPEIIPPFTLLSLQVSSRRGVREPGVVFLEDLTAITPSGEKVITDFRDLAGWHVLEDYSRPGLFALESSESVSRVDSERSVAFSWAPGSTEVHGIRAGRPETPVPAVVSRAILDIAEARVGDTLNIGMSTVSLPIQVVAVADFFPTLDPREDPFIVVDLRTFTHYTNLHLRSQRLVGGSSELWVNLDGSGQTPGQVAAALDAGGIEVKETHLASEIVSHRVEQPLVNASWGGLLVLIFLTLVLASASGVMLFSYMDTRERQTEFALLRTLGFSRVQINGVVWFNLILVVVCGVALGTWAGQMIGTSLLPILEVSEGGVRVTPPMVLQTDWVILLMSYLVLAGVTASTVVWLAWLTGKLEVQRVLRIGEA